MKLSQDGLTVFDESTGLTWQQSGSPNYMSFAAAEKYVLELNAEKFAGYNDWHLPTRAEAMTILLLQPVDSFYCDPVFDRTQRWILTADKIDSAGVAWVADFYGGSCVHDPVPDYTFVRVVR